MGAQERSRYFFRTAYSRTLRFFRHLASRIDLSDFPGSCCG